MATRISLVTASAAANAVVDLLDTGGGAGYIEIRTGTQPATVATAASGTLLGTLALSATAFGGAVDGIAVAAAISSDTTADNSGTAGWFRAYKSDATAVIDGSCSTAGNGGDMIFDTTTVVAGGVISVSSWTVTMPDGH